MTMLHAHTASSQHVMPVFQHRGPVIKTLLQCEQQRRTHESPERRDATTQRAYA